MVDANQIWSVNEAIELMKKLAPLKPMWIEEPTSPDDILGHCTISKALEYELYIFLLFYTFIKIKIQFIFEINSFMNILHCTCLWNINFIISRFRSR